MIFIWSLIILLLSSCQMKDSNSDTIHFDGIAMTMPYHVTIGHAINDQEWHDIQDVILNEFQQVHDLFDNWNPSSEISYLNRLEANTIVPISQKMYEFLTFTQSVVEITEGKFDPAIGSLKEEWKENNTCLDETIHAAQFHSIHFNKEECWKEYTLTRLDLCGIAKGYAIDCIIEALNRIGYQNVFVEWGGEIRASGKHSKKRNWQVSLLFSNNNSVISLDNCAIATSGDYMDCWKNLDSNSFLFHIIDPKNGKPRSITPTSIASVSVSAPSCALADALATAGMIFDSIDEAEQWVKRIQEHLPEVSFCFMQRESDSKRSKAEK